MSSVRPSRHTVNSYNSIATVAQRNQNISELASSLTRGEGPKQDFAVPNNRGLCESSDDQGPQSQCAFGRDIHLTQDDIEFNHMGGHEYLILCAIPQPRPKKKVAEISVRWEPVPISKSRDLAGTVHNHDHNATRNDPTLLESDGESNFDELQSSILSMHSLSVYAPTSTMSNIFSGLSHDPRSDGSIITDWADKNCLTAEQWSGRFYEQKDLDDELQTASFQGQTAVVGLLLSRGANVNAKGMSERLSQIHNK
jgi:hypothetical protein